MDHTTATRQAPGAASSTLTQVQRLDMYAGIHKALRLFLTDTLVKVGHTDAADAAHVRDTLAQVRALLSSMRKHLQHENDFIHPALERARAGASGPIADEHVAHLDAIDELQDLASVAEAADGQARATAIGRLYRALALFVAENLEHMHYEETEHNAVLWAHYTDAQLLELHDALVASIPPDEMTQTLYWMLPAMAAHERLALLSEMQPHVPAPVFDAVLGLARARLTSTDWGKLARGLGVPAAPQTWPEYVPLR